MRYCLSHSKLNLYRKLCYTAVIRQLGEQQSGMDRVKERNSNLELMRVLAIVLIVMHHYICYSGFTIPVTMRDRLVISCFFSSGKMGVDFFVVISGYYMVESRYTLRKFLKLWGQVWLYSSAIFLLCAILLCPESTPLRFENLRSAFFPLSYGTYWFPTTFVCLMLTSPILNELLHRLPRERLRVLIAVLFLLGSFLPTVARASNQLSSYGRFLLFYLIAGYIRLYPRGGRPGRHLFAALVLWLFLLLRGTVQGIFEEIYSPVTIAISAELLIFFAESKPRHSRVVNWLAAGSFGVYLFHENPFFRSYLWKTLFHGADWYGSGRLLGYSVVCCLFVVVMGLIVDWLRRLTLERLWMAAVDRALLPRGQAVLRTLHALLIAGTHALSRAFHGGRLIEDRTYRRGLMAGLAAGAATVLCLLPTALRLLKAVHGGPTAVLYEGDGYLVHALRAAVPPALAVWAALSISAARLRREKTALLAFELILRALIGLGLVSLGELLLPGSLALHLLRGESGTMFSWYALWLIAAALFCHAPTLRRFTAAWLPENQEGNKP